MLERERLISRITVNLEFMAGKPAIRGMRITVEQLLRVLAADISEKEIIEDYPEVEKEDLQSVSAHLNSLQTEEPR